MTDTTSPGTPRLGTPRPGTPRPGTPRPGTPKPGINRLGTTTPGTPRPQAATTQAARPQAARPQASRPQASRARTAGFTLMEAMVALAILATSGAALLAFYNNSINGLIRANEIQETLQLAENLQPYFNSITLLEETEQQMAINGYEIHWQATLVEPIQQGRHMSGAPGNFDLGLYDIAVTVLKEGEELDSYSTRNVSWWLGQRAPE